MIPSILVMFQLININAEARSVIITKKGMSVFKTFFSSSSSFKRAHNPIINKMLKRLLPITLLTANSLLPANDEVIDTAKTYIDENDMRFERIVAKLEADAVRAESEREQAALIRAELEKAKQKMVEENRKVEAERDKIIKTARQNAENIIDKVRRESNQLIEELERLKKQNSVDITARLQKARSAVKKSLEIIEDALKKGKTSIVLVPEISLTPQIVDRFVTRFGDNVVK